MPVNTLQDEADVAGTLPGSDYIGVVDVAAAMAFRGNDFATQVEP
jgi:hypothetical protein